jgi:hypothetical protein
MNQDNLRTLLAHLRSRAGEFLFGAAMSWVMVPHLLKRRAELERLFILLTASDLLGAPVGPQPGGLWLLPFVVPQIMYWRRRLALWGEEMEVIDLRHIGH